MTDEYIIYAIVGLALTLWIIYGIIKAATNSTEQTKLLKTQVKLLANLLVQQGMDRDKVNKLCDPDLEERERQKKIEASFNKPQKQD